MNEENDSLDDSYKLLRESSSLIANHTEEVLKYVVDKNPCPYVNFVNEERIKSACKDYIKYIGSKDYCEDGEGDYVNEIFEKAMESIYGESIWKWVNDTIEGHND